MPLGANAVPVGYVLRTHGIEGGLLLSVDPAGLRTLLAAPRVVLVAEPGMIPYRVAEVRALGQAAGRLRVWVRFVGLDTPERAQNWVGAEVRVEPQFQLPAASDDFFASELVGLRCRTREGRDLGVVREVWPTADVDQLLVEGRGGCFFLPARDEVLARIAPAEGEIEVDLDALGFDPETIG